MERIPAPRLNGEYVTIYHPQGDVYQGRETTHFTPGTHYETWVANDFSLIKHHDSYHMVGITHPKPPQFTDEFNPGEGNCHEAEEVLFHATAKGSTFADLLKDGAFTDQTKLLYPQERPDEIPFIHAPHLTKAPSGHIRMIYGPKYIRLAETDDFVNFERRVLFTDHATARDPFLFEENGIFTVIYAVENRVDYRQSTDLVHFTEARTLQVNPFGNENGILAASESPFLFKHDGFYYLMWAIYDGRLGVYDHRTFIFGARTLEGLANSAPLTMLPAHAGEIYEDESGIYLLSAYHPQNGISAVELKFEYR